MRRLFFAILFIFCGARLAHAHAGHLGELAGHAHWLGLGAVVVSGTLLALLAKAKSKAESDDDTESEPEDIEGETA